jgi:hypothetical protein
VAPDSPSLELHMVSLGCLVSMHILTLILEKNSYNIWIVFMLYSLCYRLWDDMGQLVCSITACWGQKGTLWLTLSCGGYEVGRCTLSIITKGSHIYWIYLTLGCSDNDFFIKARLLNLDPAVRLWRSLNFPHPQISYLRFGDNNSITSWNSCMNELMYSKGLGQLDTWWALSQCYHVFQ